MLELTAKTVHGFEDSEIFRTEILHSSGGIHCFFIEMFLYFNQIIYHGDVVDSLNIVDFRFLG